MDEQDLPKSVSKIAAPVVSDQATPPGAASCVVYFGDPTEVAEGFAIALRAMGIGQSEPGEDPNA